MPILKRLPAAFLATARRLGYRLTPDVLWIRARRHDGFHFRTARPAEVVSARWMIASTSRFGTGQRENSNCTPLGLHRVAQKIGNGWPAGAVFKSRRLQGFTWQGNPDAKITGRILWLEGLEPGFNRGGTVDSFRRYIYIHGTGDETTLGRPATCGCTHLADRDLVPLFDRVPVGTLVWISEY